MLDEVNLGKSMPERKEKMQPKRKTESKSIEYSLGMSECRGLDE